MPLSPDLPRTRTSTTVYRIVFKGVDPLSTEGSRKVGGRYNPVGEFAAFYTSSDESTAVAEVARGLRQRGLDPAEYAPGAWWVYELAIEIDDVLDLTDTSVLNLLGVEAASLTSDDVRLTRDLAARARAASFKALITPSATIPDSTNIVIFLDQLEKPPKILSSRPVELSFIVAP